MSLIDKCTTRRLVPCIIWFSRQPHCKNIWRYYKYKNKLHHSHLQPPVLGIRFDIVRSVGEMMHGHGLTQRHTPSHWESFSTAIIYRLWPFHPDMFREKTFCFKLTLWDGSTSTPSQNFSQIKLNIWAGNKVVMWSTSDLILQIYVNWLHRSLVTWAHSSSDMPSCPTVSWWLVLKSCHIGSTYG